MADQVTEEAPALTSTATARQTEPAVIAGISSGEGEMVWSFEIVPVGGHQRLAAGNFNAPDIEAAQQHAQTVNETGTPGFSTLQRPRPPRETDSPLEESGFEPLFPATWTTRSSSHSHSSLRDQLVPGEGPPVRIRFPPAASLART